MLSARVPEFAGGGKKEENERKRSAEMRRDRRERDKHLRSCMGGLERWLSINCLLYEQENLDPDLKHACKIRAWRHTPEL